MNALILAAGFGTRLKPWTSEHPKALVPVGGEPMLKRVISRLVENGFDNIAVNIHHFGSQIIDFLDKEEFDANIIISDERAKILDTGGGLLAASRILFKNNRESILVHNVDILSNADLKSLMEFHVREGNDITLLTSGRESSRKLAFTSEGELTGWHNLVSGELRPEKYVRLKERKETGNIEEHSFSGIYVVGERAVDSLCRYAETIGSDAFPIMDFFLHECKKEKSRLKIREKYSSDLDLIDIGKPETLDAANRRLDTVIGDGGNIGGDDLH